MTPQADLKQAMRLEVKARRKQVESDQADQHGAGVDVGSDDRSDESLVAGLSDFLGELGNQERYTVLFSALPGEPDLAALGKDQRALEATSLALTRTPSSPGGTAVRGTAMDLTVHPFDSEMERHRYGFEQPTADSLIVQDSKVSVVLVPGLAFDLKGGRLGFGAGYYDRFLTRLLAANEPGSLHIIGVGLEELVDEVPMEHHDVFMTHLAGPSGVRLAHR